MDNIPEIFNLPVETSIASGDLIPIFDVSAGQIRKITQANLLAGAGVTDHGALTGLTDVADHPGYVTLDGTRPLTADWDAGSFEIRAQTFESDVATGTAPLVIASTTAVANLNADLLDGEHASAFQDASTRLTEIAALAVSDGNIIVGDGAAWVAESGATARTSLGLGTGDSPQFTAVNIGHASDTTLARSGAGDLTIEGNAIYRAGGTDVPVADGGTGRSSHTAYAVICGGTTTTAAQQSIASVGTGGQVLTSGGGGALPAFADRITYSLGGALTTAISPADASTYYWADAKIGLAPTTTSGDHRLYVPISGKIVGAVLTMYASTATGTGETITGSIRRNNSQDFEVGTIAAASAWRSITSSALDITVTAGDYFCFMAAFPTWATNPTGIRCSGFVIIRGTA